VPAPVAGQGLDDHLRHFVGWLPGHAARRDARLHRAGRGSAAAMAGWTDACLRAGGRRRTRRRSDRLSLGALQSAAAVHRRRTGERRLLAAEQPHRQARARQRQRRHRDGRPRLPRDLADHLAGGRPRRRLVHDHHRGPGAAGATEAGASASRRSGDHLGPSGCASFAGLVRVCTDPATAAALQLGKSSRVLVINSEGNLGEGAA